MCFICDHLKEDSDLEEGLFLLGDLIDRIQTNNKLNKSIIIDYIDSIRDCGIEDEYITLELARQFQRESGVKRIYIHKKEAFDYLDFKPRYVYKLYDEDGRVVYVGQTNNVRSRIVTHISSGKEFSEAFVRLCRVWEDVNTIEAGLILKYLPKYNTLLNLDYARHWDGHEGNFESWRNLTCAWISTLIVTRQEDSYLSVFKDRNSFRNNTNIKPFWKTGVECSLGRVTPDPSCEDAVSG